MQVASKIAKNTAILYIRMAATIFISLYSTRLILAALGVADFGLFNVVGGLIAMLAFLNACMTEATQRFMSYAQGAGNKDQLKTIFNSSLILHFIIGIILLIVLEVAGYIFFNYILTIDPQRLFAGKIVYQFMIVSTLFTIISVPYDAVINAHENMLLFAILGIVESILKLAIAIIITNASGDKLILYGALMAILSVILLFCRFIYCTKKYKECKIALKSSYEKKLMIEMTTFAGWSFLGFSTSMIANYGQGIVMNVYFGAVVNAGQGISNQVSGQLSSLAHVLMKALNPSIAKSEGSGNRPFMIKTAMMGSKLSFFLLMIIFVPVIIEMPVILTLWLKNVPPYAVIFCRLLLIRNLIEQLFISLVTAISAVGNIKKFQIYSSILTFFPLLISFLLFSLGFPPYSLYIVFIIYSVIASVNIVYFAKITCDLPVMFFLKEVVLRCFASLFLSFFLSLIPYFLLKENIFGLAIVFINSFLVMSILIWLIGFNKKERNGLKDLIIGKLQQFFKFPKKAVEQL